MSEDGALEGMVLEAKAGCFDVDTSAGLRVCKLRGRLKREKKKTDLCVVGDRVRIVTTAPGEGVIEEVLPRRTVFSRRHPGQTHREDVLVANLDQLLVVFAFGDPPFHPRLLDRFLVVAEHNGVHARIVINKADQEDPAQRATALRYAELGYPVHFVSATDGTGLEELEASLEGRLSALAGSSGVGKSSLLNALSPGLAIRVAATSTAHGKGRHTTRVATLHPVAGGWVADTPGIRELGTWALPEDDLDHCFVEFRPYLGACGFRNCRHRCEPRCAVREAVEAGAIRRERYESYRLLLDEEER